MSLRLLIGRKILYIISSDAPQSGLPESEKDTFFFNLLRCISIVPAEEMLLVCGDLNGHVGKTSSGHKSITFWFEKVTSNLCMMLKSLVAKNVSHSISCLLETLS